MGGHWTGLAGLAVRRFAEAGAERHTVENWLIFPQRWHPRHLLQGHSRVEKTGPLSVLKGQCAAKLGPAPLAAMLTDRPTKAEKPSPPLLIMTGCLVPLTVSQGALGRLYVLRTDLESFHLPKR